MKKLPFHVRLGMAILACFEDHQEPITKPTLETRGPSAPTSQTAQWIPIKTIKPPIYRKVIIFTADKEILYNWARVNDTDYIHSTDDHTINNVTHWMEIKTPENSPDDQIINNENPATHIPKKPKFPGS
jgi:hypothetical protein